jgi:hypothetical protein
LKQNQQNRLSNSSLGGDQVGYLNGAVATSAGSFEPSISNQFMTPLQNFVADQAYDGGVSQSLSNRSSRSNSLMRPNDYAVTMAGMSQGINAYSMAPQPANPYAFTTPITSADMAAAQTRTTDANGLTQHLNWSQQYPTSNAESFMYTQQGTNNDNRGGKTEADMMGGETSNGNAGLYTQMYSSTSSLPSNQVFDGWNLGDPFDAKAAALIAYCFADGLPRTRTELQAMDQLKHILTAVNIKRYLQLFRTHWNEHWPTIHMPTFSTLRANNGLLLSMMCIGAIYANEMSLEMERWLMVLVKQAVERSFRTLQLVDEHSVAQGSFESTSSDVEEIEALVLLQAMFIWHGDANHRQQARDEFRRVVAIARKCALTQPVPFGRPGYSILHQPRHYQANMNLAAWDWKVWVKQEERSRIMYQIYLIDCVLAMFFNRQPSFVSSEIQIQLPADDAAWDAPDARACARALGLNGEAAQHMSNVSGSRRLSQPEFHLCIQLLFSPQSEFAPRTTNVYSKFLLIHALHTAIWSLQNQSMAQGLGPGGYGKFKVSFVEQ